MVKFGLQAGFVIHGGASLCQERDEYTVNSFGPVLWIEALPDIVQEAKKILIPYQNQIVVQAALWNQDGCGLTLQRTSNNGESSSLRKLGFHRISRPDITNLDSVQVTSITLDSLVNSLEVDFLVNDIALLVLDLQGVELEALKGSDEILVKTGAIFVEVSLLEFYKGQALFWEINEFLTERNFILVDHDLVGGTAMGDAIYMNETLYPESKFKVINNLDSIEIPTRKVSVRKNVRFLLNEINDFLHHI
jgi:FkbM family methyltransferase